MKTARVLIADDHAVVRRGLRALLEAQPGCIVCGEAATGREAVQKTRQLKPDVVILDISMPELNGLDATPLVLKAHPRAKVLVLTMHDSEEIIDRVLKTGARGYVLKSDAERDLVAAVEAITLGKTYFTSVVAELILDRLRRPARRQREGEPARKRLTPREREIVQLLAEGRSNKEAAGMLHLSTRTVESHRANIMRKLRCRSFSDLVRYAIRNKMVEL